MDLDISDSSINDSQQQILQLQPNNQKYKDYQRTLKEQQNERIRNICQSQKLNSPRHQTNLNISQKLKQQRSISKPKTPNSRTPTVNNKGPNSQDYLKGTGCFKQLHEKNSEIQLLMEKYQRYKQKASKYKKKCMEMYSMIQIMEEKVKETEKYRQNVNDLEQKVIENQKIREDEYDDMKITINRLQQELDQQQQLFNQRQEKQQQDDLERYEEQLQEIEQKHFQLIQSNQKKSQMLKDKEQLLVQQCQQIDELQRQFDDCAAERDRYQSLNKQNEHYKQKYLDLKKEMQNQQEFEQYKSSANINININGNNAKSNNKSGQNNCYHDLLVQIRNIKEEIDGLEFK